MELIKITEQNGKNVVSARELHQFLGNTDNVNTWFKRQSERAMLVENEDFISVAFLQPSGQNAIDYAISINSAKYLKKLLKTSQQSKTPILSIFTSLKTAC